MISHFSQQQNGKRSSKLKQMLRGFDLFIRRKIKMNLNKLMICAGDTQVRPYNSPEMNALITKWVITYNENYLVAEQRSH